MDESDHHLFEPLVNLAHQKVDGALTWRNLLQQLQIMKRLLYTLITHSRSVILENFVDLKAIQVDEDARALELGQRILRVAPDGFLQHLKSLRILLTGLQSLRARVSEHCERGESECDLDTIPT